jgi:hypothetical protein
VKPADEKAAIAEAVADLRERFGLRADSAQRGPVRLARFVEECNLLHVTLATLTRSKIVEYLTGEGFSPDEQLLAEEPDELLAGCLLRMNADGFIFVGQQEPVETDEGERKVRFTTQPRQRFTVAHELGHFILHQHEMGRFIADTKDLIREEGDAKKIADMERQANRFAAELLMPAEVCIARAKEFRAKYEVLPLQPFAYQLAAELLVSPEAMRYRLKDAEIQQHLGELEVADD